MSDFQLRCEPHVEAGIEMLGALLSNGDGYMNPTANVGPAADFANGTFEMRAFCWCSGDLQGHEEGCPPNFRVEDFKVSWYKHSRRGATQNRSMPYEQWRLVLLACLASLAPAQQQTKSKQRGSGA